MNSQPFISYILGEFPTLDYFEIDHSAHRVLPVSYEHPRHGTKLEYPPVARWRVGDRRYAYVLSPAFVQRTIHWNVFFKETVLEPDYRSEDNKLMQIIQWSVDGLDDKQINFKLHGREVPPELKDTP